MTTKFSRNRARVQPTPKVCKSPKKIPTAAPSYPLTINAGGTWNFAFGMFPFSTMTAGAVCTKVSDGVYTGTVHDNQGRTWTMTVTITIGSTATIIFTCATFPAGPNQVSGTNTVWDGTRPYLKTLQPCTLKPGLLGSATWSWSVV